MNIGKATQRKYNVTVSGSRKANVTVSTSTNFTLVALVDGRGPERGTIGMAAIDLRSMEVSLYEFIDTTAFNFLKISLGLLDPLEIILPDNSHDISGTVKLLREAISSAFPDSEIQLVQRRYFDDVKGVEMVKRCIVDEVSNVDHHACKKIFAMAAAFALLKYVEQIQNIEFLPKSLRFSFQPLEDSCMIDIASWEYLDLFQRSRSSRSSGCRYLFDRLNACVTNGGSRTLSSFLLQPSFDVNEISERLDVVEEFLMEPATLEKVRRLLSTVQDLQQIVALCAHADKSMPKCGDGKRLMRQNIVQILSLRNLLDALQPMTGILKNIKSSLIMRNIAKITDGRLSDILSIVDDKIDSEVLATKGRGSLGAKDAVLYAVKDSQHVQLALVRRVYDELLVHVNELVAEEGFQELGASLSYTFGRGYHYVIKKSAIQSLPAICMQVVSNRQTVTFTTHNLIKYNDRLCQLESEILQKSEVVVSQCLTEVREFLPALYNCVDFLSLLDCLCAFAHYARGLVDAARPRFGNHIAIRGGKHPVLCDDSDEVVPNDTFVSPDTRFVLITGPNMAGKSTYLKQVCLLQIMAQAGCFVPAKAAMFMPRKSIFCRMGHNDDLGDSLSSFGVEMSEMATILQHANESSLVVVDELARSTAVEEGVSICYAIIEKMVQLSSIVLFATHYLDLCLLETQFTCLRNFHFPANNGVNEAGKEVFIPSHVLALGPYNGPLYGLELAELAGLPEDIVRTAQTIAERIRADVEQKRSAGNDSTGMDRKRQLSVLAHRLLHLAHCERYLSQDVLQNSLANLQDKFRNLLV